MVPQLGGFLLPNDLGLVHVLIRLADQGSARNELKILDSHVGMPIAEQRQQCETGLLVFCPAI